MSKPIKYDRYIFGFNERAVVWVGARYIRLPDGTCLKCETHEHAKALCDMINLMVISQHHETQ